MQATTIFANLRVPDIEAAKGFYTDYLGLTNEEFNMGWSPGTPRPTPGRGCSSSPMRQPRPRIRSFRSASITSTAHMQKLGNWATRSCMH